MRLLSPTEQTFLDNPEQFSNRKQRYLRYRIRKKLNVAAQQQLQCRGGNERRMEDSLVERYLGKVEVLFWGGFLLQIGRGPGLESRPRLFSYFRSQLMVTLYQAELPRHFYHHYYYCNILQSCGFLQCQLSPFPLIAATLDD